MFYFHHIHIPLTVLRLNFGMKMFLSKYIQVYGYYSTHDFLSAESCPGIKIPRPLEIIEPGYPISEQSYTQTDNHEKNTASTSTKKPVQDQYKPIEYQQYTSDNKPVAQQILPVSQPSNFISTNTILYLSNVLLFYRHLVYSISQQFYTALKPGYVGTGRRKWQPLRQGLYEYGIRILKDIVGFF